jgi:hypothetical protein
MTSIFYTGEVRGSTRGTLIPHNSYIRALVQFGLVRGWSHSHLRRSLIPIFIPPNANIKVSPSLEPGHGHDEPDGKCNQSKFSGHEAHCSHVLSIPLATRCEFLSTHPPVIAGMNPAYFRIVPAVREIVETERKYVKNIELVQVRSTTQPHDRRSCYCGIFDNLFTLV